MCCCGISGLGRPTVEKCKTVLCSLFNTAVNDRVVGVHPCRGVGTAAVVQGKLRILTPPEYARVYAHLRDDYARLMVDVLLETGCRWGEFAELRVRDLDVLACTVTVARTVVEVKARYVPEGESGFRVKEYPKNRHWRTVAISRGLTDRLAAHLSGRGRGALMFPAVGRSAGRRSEPGDVPREPETFKLNGRSFTHGTLYTYTKGACRCEACREEMAAYRAARRGSGKDRPAKTQVSEAVREARRMRRDWFRYRVLGPAIEAAALGWRVRTHDLRPRAHRGRWRALAGVGGRWRAGRRCSRCASTLGTSRCARSNGAYTTCPAPMPAPPGRSPGSKPPGCSTRWSPPATPRLRPRLLHARSYPAKPRARTHRRCSRFRSSALLLCSRFDRRRPAQPRRPPNRSRRSLRAPIQSLRRQTGPHS